MLFEFLDNCPSHKPTSMSTSTQVGCEDRVRGADTHSAMEWLILVVLLSFLLLVARVEVLENCLLGNHTLSMHCDFKASSHREAKHCFLKIYVT
jgi:hypothetical protein